MAKSGALELTQALNANKFQTAKYLYPFDLDPNLNPYVLFEVRDAVAKNAAVLSTFVLYMPPTVKTNYRGKWEDVELSYQQLADVVDDVFGGLADSDGRFRRRVGIATGNILGSITGTNARAQAEIASGLMVNPHAALQFKGMEFREFRMEFHLMAKNAAESIQIQSIIDTLRYHMHPDVEPGASSIGTKFFLYPEHFNIQLFSPSDKFLFKFHDCILADMEVDYAGSGVPSFFTSTGAPVDIRMNLTFKELAVLTKDDFRKDVEGGSGIVIPPTSAE